MRTKVNHLDFCRF